MGIRQQLQPHVSLPTCMPHMRSMLRCVSCCFALASYDHALVKQSLGCFCKATTLTLIDLLAMRLLGLTFTFPDTSSS